MFLKLAKMKFIFLEFFEDCTESSYQAPECWSVLRYRANRARRFEIVDDTTKLLNWINIITFLWFIVGQSWIYGVHDCKNSALYIYCLSKFSLHLYFYHTCDARSEGGSVHENRQIKKCVFFSLLIYPTIEYK